MKTELGRAVLLVDDFDEAFKFYEENLGCKKFFDLIDDKGRRYLHIGFNSESSAGLWFIKAETDEEKKLVKQRGIEGGVMEDYKSIVGTCHVIPKDKEVSIVKWTLEYEKKHAGIPEPTALLDACLLAAKHVDDHHHGIKQSN